MTYIENIFLCLALPMLLSLLFTSGSPRRFTLFVVLGTIPDGTPRTLAALKTAGIPVFAYGNFITVAVNFAILAFIIFLMIKQINRLKREAPTAPPAPEVTPEEVLLLREIRDQLRR